MGACRSSIARFDCLISAGDETYMAIVTLSGLRTPLVDMVAAGRPSNAFSTGPTYSDGLVNREIGRRRDRPVVRMRSVTHVLTADGELVRLGASEGQALYSLIEHELTVVGAHYAD